jgi:protein tyrosine/serine phosphatase
MPVPSSACRVSALVALLVALLPRSGAAQAASAAIPIERFQQVDTFLYRGAQPSERDFRRLRQLGVATVINLRMEPDAVKTGEKRIVEELGMTYVSIPVEDGNFFTRSRTIPEAAIREFFRIVDEASRAGNPVFVHCHRGADRTGAMVAFYRIARQGWETARAEREARDVGMRSWYRGLQRQIRTFDPGALALTTAQ